MKSPFCFIIQNRGSGRLCKAYDLFFVQGPCLLSSLPMSGREELSIMFHDTVHFLFSWKIYIYFAILLYSSGGRHFPFERPPFWTTLVITAVFFSVFSEDSPIQTVRGQKQLSFQGVKTIASSLYVNFNKHWNIEVEGGIKVPTSGETGIKLNISTCLFQNLEWE